MLFTQILLGYNLVSPTFLLAQVKVTAVSVHELSRIRCVGYQTIYAKVIRGMFLNKPLAKVIGTEAHKLSGLRCVSYHAIAQKLPRGYFINPFPHAKVVSTEVHKLSGMRCLNYHFIHIKSYLGDISSITVFDEDFLGSKKLPRCLYVSYQLCCAYFTMFFIQNLPVMFSNTFPPEP